MQNDKDLSGKNEIGRRSRGRFSPGAKSDPSRAREVLAVLIAVALIGWGRPASADPMRDFIVSCSYGVLAGTLVGAATLAFSDKPGDNLNRVARGASIGLYSGILLGAYVIYGVPGEDDEAATVYSPAQSHGRTDVAEANFRLLPVLSERGLEGVVGQFAILRF